MDIKSIQELLKQVNRSNLEEVEIEQKDFRIRIKKQTAEKNVVVSTVAPQPIAIQQPVQEVAAPVAEQKPAPEQKAAPAAEDNLITIKSPMIGTFYRSPSPDKEPFAKVGDTISSGQVLCIIEAMKLFNEIESEVEGKIVKILVDNATPVEYDQPLFLVEPSK